jgi:hypothetical protein
MRTPVPRAAALLAACALAAAGCDLDNAGGWPGMARAVVRERQVSGQRTPFNATQAPAWVPGATGSSQLASAPRGGGPSSRAAPVPTAAARGVPFVPTELDAPRLGRD